jgi:hypothetical protein
MGKERTQKLLNPKSEAILKKMGYSNIFDQNISEQFGDNQSEVLGRLGLDPSKYEIVGAQ